MVCPDCTRKQKPAEPLRGVLEVHFKGKLPKKFDILDFLPVQENFFQNPVGGTPLWEPENLRDKYGFKIYTSKMTHAIHPLHSR